MEGNYIVYAGQGLVDESTRLNESGRLMGPDCDGLFGQAEGDHISLAQACARKAARQPSGKALLAAGQNSLKAIPGKEQSIDAHLNGIGRGSGVSGEHLDLLGADGEQGLIADVRLTALMRSAPDVTCAGDGELNPIVMALRDAAFDFGKTADEIAHKGGARLIIELHG